MKSLWKVSAKFPKYKLKRKCKCLVPEMFYQREMYLRDWMKLSEGNFSQLSSNRFSKNIAIHEEYFIFSSPPGESLLAPAKFVFAVGQLRTHRAPPPAT